jgi:hypothetical protein
MSTLRPKDARPLCSFPFVDGRQCRTPRFSGRTGIQPSGFFLTLPTVNC